MEFNEHVLLLTTMSDHAISVIMRNRKHWANRPDAQAQAERFLPPGGRFARRPQMSTRSFNIACPNCKVQFPLTATLAQPFIDTERAKAQQEDQERAAIARKRDQELAQREKAMAELKDQLDTRQTEIDA